jgi:lipopolysaccharide/colanic/teichoic acid biosynthesis glycosyltransferase
MSIVGPRPSLPYEYEIYKEWHKRRLEVLPGITGLWQVYGHNTVRFDDMVRLDLNYIRRMSLWLDIKIIMKTPFEMLFGKGRG